MSLSRRTNAHVTSFFEVDLTRVARIRAKLRADFEKQSGEKLTYLPFILTAVTAALKQFPILNAAVAGNSIIYRKQYKPRHRRRARLGPHRAGHQARRRAVPGGPNAAAQRPRHTRAGEEAAARRVQDATFTITNPGVFGSLMGTPIIPVPTTAILGLGAIEKRPKVITGPDGEDTIAIRTCAFFSLSFDHRVIDGSVADQFLATVKAHARDVRRKRSVACRGRSRSSGRRCHATSGMPTSPASANDVTACVLPSVTSVVYEDPGEPGLFVEFIEARDADTLAAGRATVFESNVGAPILTEVELS
jgi:pyruvate/2-oxoglutarate dehydrogenase complex dihydrolipoamide acyltransferase (E2) component